MPPEAEVADKLTEEQAAVYDRQLRLWGHEVQQRLTQARVLIIGGDGLAAEIAKNLTLAGVGHVALSDDTPASEAAFGNFLVAADVPSTSSVAQASAHTLQAMNPLISLSTTSLGGAQGSSLPQLQAEQLAPYDLVVSTCGISVQAADRLEALCAEAGKQLYVGEVAGPNAVAFIHLGSAHTFMEKQQPSDQDKENGGEKGKEEPKAPPKPVTLAYPRLAAALSKPVKECLGRRPVHALYQVVRAARACEAKFGRPLHGADDLEALKAAAAELESSEGAPAGSISPSLLESWLLDRRGVSPGADTASAAVCAVAGGALANSVVRTISRVGAPLKNWFFFSLFDGSGSVEDIGSA